MASWSASTCKQYESVLRKRKKYCNETFIDPYQPNINNVVEFLTHTFKPRDIQYSGMNTIRSMLSSFITQTDGVTIGNQPLAKRFMKGILKLRLSLPKYIVTYDAGIVLISS